MQIQNFSSAQQFGIKNAKLLSTSFTSLNGAMVVTRGKIESIGPSEEIQKKYPQLNFIDGSDFTITPGLINSHTHLAMSFFRDLGHQSSDIIKNLFFPAEAKLNSQDVELFAYSSILAGLQSGVTTFVDHYYFIEGVARALNQFKVRGVIGETIADIRGPFSGADSWPRAKAIIENWKWNERITPAVCPHAVDTVSPKLLKELSNYALKNDLLLHMHLSQTKNEHTEISKLHNLSPVQLAEKCGALTDRSLIVHLVSATADDVKIIKKNGSTIGFCPASQSIYEKVSPFESFLDFEIPLALGTDSAGCNDGMDLMSEVRTFGLFARDRGFEFPVYQKIFDSVTSTPAKALGLKNLGDLKVGFKADLVFFKNELSRLPIHNLLTNFIFSTSSKHVKHVMIEGDWVLFDQKPIHVNEGDKIEKFTSAVKKYF